jgi:predicted nucleotidyltransferase
VAFFYEDVLRGLTGQGVEFVIVGGTAVILQGVPRTTADLDIVPALDAENVRRLVAKLVELGYRPRAPVDPLGLANADLRREWLEDKGMLAFSFWHPERPLDAVDVLYASPLDFAELAASARFLEIADLRLRVASPEHLIAMKQGTGRAQDEFDIHALRRLLDAQRK